MNQGHQDHKSTSNRTQDIEVWSENTAPRILAGGENTQTTTHDEITPDTAPQEHSLEELGNIIGSNLSPESHTNQLAAVVGPSSQATTASMEAYGLSNSSSESEEQGFALDGEDVLLAKLRNKFLYDIGAGTPDIERLMIVNGGSSKMAMMDKGGRIVKLDLFSKEGTEAGKTAAQFAENIRSAWPQDRVVERTTQFILEGDGHSSVTRILVRNLLHGSSLAEYDRLFYEYGVEAYNALQYMERSQLRILWQKSCLQAADMQNKQPATIQGPPDKFRGNLIFCCLNPWKTSQHIFPLDKLASVLCYDEPFPLPSCKWNLRTTYHIFDMGWLLSFIRRGFRGGGACEINGTLPSFVHWQIRYFRPQTQDSSSAVETYPAEVYVCGDRHRATIGRNFDRVILEEKRARVSLRLFSLFPGLFNIVVLTDEDMSPGGGEWDRNDKGASTGAAWPRYNLRPCGNGTPITHFLFEVLRVFDRSFDAWDETLNSIDKLVHVNLADFGDEKRVEELMFDKSFTRSKDYFVALQLLRIMAEWVDEIMPSIERLRYTEGFQDNLYGAGAANDNLDTAIRIMRDRGDKIQTRIRTKSEEIKSLRDGLFNATSLREATKAMALNQAIYVFTVVTVLFTPVSFLATFWALPFLNNPVGDKVPEPASFRNSFIIMPLLTYAFVVVIAWYMRPDKARYTLPSKLVRNIVKDTLYSLRKGLLAILSRWERGSTKGDNTKELA